MDRKTISTRTLTLSATTLVFGAFAMVVSGGMAFAGQPVDANLDLPLEKPVAKAPPAKAPAPVQTTAPVASTPPSFFGKDLQNTGSIIYVIDQSGSMTLTIGAYTDPNTGKIVAGATRFDRAKAEIIRSITSLPSSFSFNIVFFDECVRPWKGANVTATDKNKAEATSFIGSQQPLGFTNTGLAVAQALSDKSIKSVVVLSDGEPNFLDCAANYVGSYDQHRGLIRQANTQGARVDCFGIGVAGNMDAKMFMMNVASDSAGTYTEIN